jgi:type IV pilus assembly protein PilB
LGFNLGFELADGGRMSDVDAVRWMASEHDLEFVDLDTYGVDPAAREILSVSISRRHHVVAVKRKFGTPVIATADPDDLTAQDTVRESIGRDFISVVASRDQINDYLDQLFGAEPNDGDFAKFPAQGETAESASAHSQGAAPPFGLDDMAARIGSVIGEEDESSVREAEPIATEPIADLADLAVTPPEPDSVRTGDEPGQSPAGKRRRRRDETKHKAEKPVGKQREREITESPESVDLDAHSSESNHIGRDQPTEYPEDSEAHSAPIVQFSTDISTDHGQYQSALEPENAPFVGSGPEENLHPAVDIDDLATMPEAAAERDDPLEPATSVLPQFASDPESLDWSVGAPDSDEDADPLAALARSVEDQEQTPGSDSTTEAADLVAEAVATYQEKHGDERRVDGTESGMPTGTSTFPPLAQALVEGGRVTLEDMEGVLQEHYQTGQSVARILTARGLVTEADLMWGMAEEMGLDFVDLDTVGVDFSEAGLIPEATARHHNVIVIANDDGTPVVAASNPTDVFAMDDLRTIMGRPFIVVVATRSQISSYIGRAFNSGGDAADMAMEASRGFDGSESESGVDDIQAVTEEAPIVRYVNLLILQALNERASDIHVEPTTSELRIRYRIDGVLHDVSTAPRTISAAVITRLKVMADMNVAEHRIPQDGRISLNVGSKGIDLRIATLPTIHGEKVVMRVLDKSSVVLGFPDLGFDGDLLATYEGLYTKPYGTILVTGPTGSGKSTTLYTTLTALNSPEKNIITVEDPVELQLRGVNQIQLNVKAGLTFASALRSILRSDPDIVLVGEIRDKETALISIEAALTGHMVLATLHTNSAAATPMRLIEMGLEPFLVTSALSGVLAQRLARRLCVHCKEAYEPTEADIAAAGWSTKEVEAAGGISKVFRSVGCSACSNTGYRGRKALAELLPMTEEIERSIIEGGSVEDIHRLAVAQGMLTLRQSGLRKAIEGETTLEEVLRVVA